MAYIRKKTSGVNTYYYLVEGYRHNGKVRQRQLAYLGVHSTVDAAYAFHCKQSKKKRHPRWDASPETIAAWEATCIPESKRVWHEEQAEALYQYTTKGSAEHQAKEDEANAEAAERFPGIPVKDARAIDDGDDSERLREMYPEIFARLEAEEAERERQMEERHAAFHRGLPHVVLGIRHNATMDEIKAAHRALCQKWHPDINPSEGATRRMQEINAAYTQLKSQAAY